jgi:hypothetical protein
VSAERTPVFNLGPQPEKPKPDRVNLLPKIERTREEKVEDITKQLSSLAVYKMSGNTEEISKKNFPDISTDLIEEACYFSDKYMCRLLEGDVKDVTDPETKALVEQKIAKLEKRRNERYKAYLKSTQNEASSSEPEPQKTQTAKIQTLQPQKTIRNDGMYL